MRVLGMGNALLDVIYRLEDDTLLKRFSLQPGSMTLIDRERLSAIEEAVVGMDQVMVSGGSAANTIHGLSALGIACGFVGSLGKDREGDFYFDEMEKLGIVPHFLRSETPSGRAMAFVSPDGERTFATYLGAALELDDSLISPEWFNGWDVFHIEGYLVQNHKLISHAMGMARAAGCKVSLDMASFNVVEENLDFLRSALPGKVDILFANEEEARAFTGKEPEDALDEMASMCDTAVVKVGREGAYIRQGSFKVHVPAHPVKVVDTSGAGDLFAAGYLYGLSRMMDPETCGMVGTLLASKVIKLLGPKIPDAVCAALRDEVNMFALEGDGCFDS